MKKTDSKKRIIGILIILIGCVVAVYPLVSAISVKTENEMEIKKIEKISMNINSSEIESSKNRKKNKEEIMVTTEQSKGIGGLYPEIDYNKLYFELYEYNQKLLLNGQTLTDAVDYEIFPVSLTSYGLDNNLFGYIHIPSIQLKLPLYLGSEENSLRNGAAVMGNTSAPIGGAGTNCVIAAHNGWNGVKRFIKCEALKEDDLIYITNLYETLCYKVIDNFVTTDSDMTPVLIKEDEDLITLVTCYPYTGFQTKERLIIRAERVKCG